MTELRDALEGRSSMSNPALVAPRPSSVKTFEHPTSEGHVSLHHAVSVRSGGTRKAVSATTRQKKKVPGAPRDVKDALDRLGIGSPKMNGGTLRTLSRSPLNKPESLYVVILFVANRRLIMASSFLGSRFRPRNSKKWGHVSDWDRCSYPHSWTLSRLPDKGDQFMIQLAVIVSASLRDLSIPSKSIGVFSIYYSSGKYGDHARTGTF